MLILALLAGTSAAFALTEVLKLERSPVGRPRFTHVFSPTCGCSHATARFALRLHHADRVTATVVNADGTAVRTLASGRRQAGPFVFRWDGRNDAGAVVPDGSYRLRLGFANAGRTIVIPKTVRVDTQAPTVTLVHVTPRRLSPGATATVLFRVSEAARPLVLVDGTVAVRGPRAPAGTRSLTWPGTLRGRSLRAGVHVVTVRARDLAGNLSAPSTGMRVRVRPGR